MFIFHCCEFMFEIINNIYLKHTSFNYSKKCLPQRLNVSKNAQTNVNAYKNNSTHCNKLNTTK